MKDIPKKLPIIFLVAFLFAPAMTFAHQPNIVSDRIITIPKPEVSKVYYGELTGSPHIYKISANSTFELYVNILAPDIKEQKKDISGKIIKDGDADNPIAILDGVNFKWTRYWEEFGRNWYWMGPEYKNMMNAGEYEIHITSVNSDSKYALAIGQIESFTGNEIINALILIPKIKKQFFNESPATFILSPLGWGSVLVLYVFAFIGGFILRAFFKKFAKNSQHGLEKNIGGKDRLFRLAIGLISLLFAITTTWNPILLVFSGFVIFEASFSWCGIYALLGKSTCEINP